MKLSKRAVALRDTVLENAKTQSVDQVARTLGLKPAEVRQIIMQR